MNWIDLTLLLLAAACVASGVRQGFSREGFGMLAILAAFLVAAWAYPGTLQGFGIVFAGGLLAIMLTSWLLGKWIRRTSPRWLDGLLGGIVGFANAIVLCVIAAIAVMAFAPRLPHQWVSRSNIAPLVVEAACTAAEAVPGEMRTRVEQRYDELRDAMPPRFKRAIPPASGNVI